MDETVVQLPKTADTLTSSASKDFQKRQMEEFTLIEAIIFQSIEWDVIELCAVLATNEPFYGNRSIQYDTSFSIVRLHEAPSTRSHSLAMEIGVINIKRQLKSCDSCTLFRREKCPENEATNACGKKDVYKLLYLLSSYMQSAPSEKCASSLSFISFQ